MTNTSKPDSPAPRVESEDAPTYSRIVVPLDATPFAEAALRPAAELAVRAGGSLHLVTALTQDAGQVATVEPVMRSDRLEPVQRAEELETYLAESSDRVREQWGCSVSFRVLPQGSTAHAVVRYAEEIRADILVAATHSRGVIARTFMGSIARDLVHAAPCPVLLIPSADSAPDPDSTPLQASVRSVVAALGPRGGPDDVALTHALAHAHLWDATLQLVQVAVAPTLSTVGPSGAGPMSAAPKLALGSTMREAAEKRIAGLVADLRDRGVDAHANVLTGARAADAVVDFVESSEADLVVVGRRDKGLLERMVMGSESDRVVRRIRSAGILICPLDG